jgi:hypothetical protein
LPFFSGQKQAAGQRKAAVKRFYKAISPANFSVNKNEDNDKREKEVKI